MAEDDIIAKPSAQLAYARITEVAQFMVMGGLLVPDGWLKGGGR